MQLVPDIAAFLASHRRAFLVTVTSDGHPTVHPLSLINSDDGLFFNTYRKSAKVRNLRRDPQVACVVASADDDDPFRAIEVVGMAEVVDPDRLPDSLLHGSASDANGVMS